MSARYEGLPSSYGQRSPREHEHQGGSVAPRVSPSSGQFQRLPSLSSWAHPGPPPIAIPLEYPLREARGEIDHSSYLYSYSAVEPNYQPVDSESYSQGPVSNITALENPHEKNRPGMCFRGGSYKNTGHDEPRPRPVTEMTQQVAVAPPGYSQYPSRPPSYHATVMASKEQSVASGGWSETQSKRQAGSLSPQLPPAKKTREQSPPRARPRFRTRDVVPNLLGPDKAHLVRNLRFTLKIRQQPQQARSCGFADKDRRSIDPPPIVELKIEGDGLSKQDIEVYMNYDRYVMCCTLLDENGVDAMNMEQDGLRSKRMMGENTVVPFVGNDEHGELGCFFSFNDLSCRTPGEYRLSFSVSTLPTLEESRSGVRYPRMTDITSDIFKAYNAKLFPGMTESSALAKALKEQGCNISVRKGNEKTKNSRSRDAARDDDDDEDDD